MLIQPEGIAAVVGSSGWPLFLIIVIVLLAGVVTPSMKLSIRFYSQRDF